MVNLNTRLAYEVCVLDKEIDVIKLVEELENKTEKMKKPIHIAVMGCAVNGPGESKKADIGIVGGAGDTNLLYRNGQIVGKIPHGKISETLIAEVERIVREN